MLPDGGWAWNRERNDEPHIAAVNQFLKQVAYAYVFDSVQTRLIRTSLLRVWRTCPQIKEAHVCVQMLSTHGEKSYFLEIHRIAYKRVYYPTNDGINTAPCPLGSTVTKDSLKQ